MLDCGVQGGDQVTTVGYLARTLLCQGVVVASIPDSEGGGGVPERLGARQFEMFGPVATDFINYVRTISLVRDGSRWRFDTAGTVQDFEDVGAYQRRKVVERFTPAMLTEYASALGLEPFQADFYPGPSALVVSPETPPPGALVLTIAEAQRWAESNQGRSRLAPVTGTRTEALRRPGFGKAELLRRQQRCTSLSVSGSRTYCATSLRSSGRVAPMA